MEGGELPILVRIKGGSIRNSGIGGATGDIFHPWRMNNSGRAFYKPSDPGCGAGSHSYRTATATEAKAFRLGCKNIKNIDAYKNRVEQYEIY
jgi:hypothetical protein